MSEDYYRTGQAAKELDVSSYHVRRLCECGLIDAELTSGRQWRIPLSEVTRLKKEGMPPIPQAIKKSPRSAEALESELVPSSDSHDLQRTGSGQPQRLYNPPSADLIQSAEQVSITENRVRKRRLEREFEEVEDFFRDRERNQRAELAAERRRATEIVAEQTRRTWRDRWLEYALDSAPWDAPKRVELSIHAAVEDTLAQLDPDQPDDLVERLVEAAVENALAPWRQAETRQRALEAARIGLPWAMQSTRDYADLKQRAFDLAAEAIDRQPPDSTEWELADAARQAVEPVVDEYEHREACESVVASVVLPGAGLEELEAAREATRESLGELPVGVSKAKLEESRDLALAPVQHGISQRQAQEQQRKADDLRRFRAGLSADLHLGHVNTYLQEAFEFDGGYLELSREAERLRAPIRQRLVEFLTQNANAGTTEVRELVEEWVDELLPE